MNGPFARTGSLVANLAFRLSSSFIPAESMSSNDFEMTERRDTPDNEDTDRESGVATRTRPKTKRPSQYRVLLLNDDYTPMEFVVYVLERYFKKNREEAMQIMLHVHNNGVGVCGVYTYEVAETKVAQVLDLARRNEHPLQCTMEKDD